jgi:hypothetical protein
MVREIPVVRGIASAPNSSVSWSREASSGSRALPIQGDERASGHGSDATIQANMGP